jgi:hypothetical protein
MINAAAVTYAPTAQSTVCPLTPPVETRPSVWPFGNAVPTQQYLVHELTFDPSRIREAT